MAFKIPKEASYAVKNMPDIAQNENEKNINLMLKKKIKSNISELIGRTPMLRLNNYMKAEGMQADIIAKLEYFSPTGSVKDRAADNMIRAAEESGALAFGATIIEPTSGNTGIGLASVGRAKGYKVILTMPETMSPERITLIKAYGADVVLTEGAKGMAGAIEKAKQLEADIDGAVILGQFENPANPQAHYETTGPEIWYDTDGTIDIFVAGVGTGGTLSGTGKYLKEQNPDIKVIAAEPLASPVLTKGVSGPHKIQGIGANFVPDTLDTSVYDEVVCVPNEAAIETAYKISKTEGILVGISSGAALWAAGEIAKRQENRGKRIVVIFPDSGDRYLSAGIF